MTYIREQFANDAASSLASAITSSQTTLTVNLATPFPSTGPFRIIIDNEIIIVGSVSGTTFGSLTRGAEGTTAANHLVNTAVTHVLTKGSMSRLVRDNMPFADDSNRPALNSLVDASGNPLTSSSFTVINGTLATITDENSGPISVAKTKLSSGGEDVCALVRSAPATPYSVVAAMDGILPDPTEFSGYGLCFRESSSGKMLTGPVLSMNGGSAFLQAAVYEMLSPTNYSGTALVSRFSCSMPSPKWMKISDDGVNVAFYLSHNGIQWIQIASASRTAFLSTGPNQVGFCVSSSFNTSFGIAASLLSWNGA